MSDFNDNFKNSVTILIKGIRNFKWVAPHWHHSRAVHSQITANVDYMVTTLTPLSCALAYRAGHKWTLTSTSLLDYLGAISHSPNLPTLLITVSWRFYKPTRYKLAQPHHTGSAPCSSIQTMENSLLRGLEVQIWRILQCLAPVACNLPHKTVKTMFTLHKSSACNCKW